MRTGELLCERQTGAASAVLGDAPPQKYRAGSRQNVDESDWRSQVFHTTQVTTKWKLPMGTFTARRLP